LETQVEPGQQIQGIKESRPELRRALERSEQFLGLAALVAVILAGAAIAVAAHYFSQKQADAAAVMRCLGATQKLILQIYLFRLILLAIEASHEERLYEGAILRTLGATRRQVLLGLGAEFITLGILAGMLAALTASGIAYVLAEYIFELPYHFNIWIAIIGIIGGGVGIGLAGILGTYSILQQPPSAILQKANF